MRIQQIILSMTAASLAMAVNAMPFFQAGDIQVGNKVSISKESGVASYFVEGISGQVEFTCDLQGQANQNESELSALLRPGKNFTNEYNPVLISLHPGINGPFLWTLTDEGSKTGNIKIHYSNGTDVTVQCIGKKR